MHKPQFPQSSTPAWRHPGKAVVHAYTAGNEPYSLWEGLDRRSQEYKQLKVWTILLDILAVKSTVVGHACSPCQVGEALHMCAWA